MALELDDIRPGATTDTSVLAVRHGKRNRARDIPINSVARRVLRRYLDVRPASTSERLFLGQRGPIDPEAVQRIVRKHARLARLEDVTPHNVRHTFAKRTLEAGEPDVTVARLLGHTSVETTAIYTQPGWDDRVGTVERRGGEGETGS